MIVGESILTVLRGLARNVKPHGGKQVGILGLGYSVREADAHNLGIHYPNLVETLVIAGQIAPRLYSPHLSGHGQYGSIIFGGVDTQKFEGDLVTMNCFPTGDTVRNFGLVMSGVTIVDGNGTTTQLVDEANIQYGLFDSGATA
jgi:hypothetical protein